MRFLCYDRDRLRPACQLLASAVLPLFGCLLSLMRKSCRALQLIKKASARRRTTAASVAKSRCLRAVRLLTTPLAHLVGSHNAPLCPAFFSSPSPSKPGRRSGRPCRTQQAILRRPSWLPQLRRTAIAHAPKQVSCGKPTCLAHAPRSQDSQFLSCHRSAAQTGRQHLVSCALASQSQCLRASSRNRSGSLPCCLSGGGALRDTTLGNRPTVM